MPNATPPPVGATHRKIVDDIDKTGWHVVNVLADRRSPGWSYTIGLHQSYGHAELITFGLPPRTAHGILNIAGKEIKAGKVYAADVRYDEFAVNYACVLRPVQSQWYAPFVARATWAHGGAAFPLMQIFWPDPEGVMPWEPGVQAWVCKDQPALYAQTAAEARVQPLLDAHDDLVAALAAPRRRRTRGRSV